MNYLLRDINASLWKRFTAQVARDGLTAKAALLALVQLYVDRQITIKSRVEATVAEVKA